MDLYVICFHNLILDEKGVSSLAPMPYEQAILLVNAQNEKWANICHYWVEKVK